MEIIGRVVNIVEEKIVPARIVIENHRIQAIHPLTEEEASAFPLPYILPGFVDAHVHIESSLLIPSEFARLAVVHGTVATVSDPHEIANVCGLPGVEFMIRNGKSVPFYFNFGAPSCVPATRFETAGATLDAAAVGELLSSDDIKYLSEMMDFPGVLAKAPEPMAKIAIAQRLGKPVDGHAPGLRGDQARDYIAAGISTDHESFTAEEALDKLRYGMKILIREGSAARNFDALIPLLNDYPDQMMFCSDDKHPDSLVAGHINQLCARAVAKGINVYKVLKAACLNPVLHYKLDNGQLRPGDPADLILVEDLVHFQVRQTWIKGQLVADNGRSHITTPHLPGADPINKFRATPREVEDFSYPLDKWGEQENVEQVYVIEALDGQLITNKQVVPVADTLPREGRLHANPEKDILKIVVVNRYHQAPVAKSFIRNFGLKRGAIASSVAHDSHNIVAVGVDDESICQAINLIIGHKGGLSLVDPGATTTGSGTSTPTPTTGGNLTPTPSGSATPTATSGGATPAPNPTTTPAHPATHSQLILPLPVAGLMSLNDGYQVAEHYTALDHKAKAMGSRLGAPFMTLSFMALLVIPHLKLGDLGLFDGDKFALL